MQCQLKDTDFLSLFLKIRESCFIFVFLFLLLTATTIEAASLSLSPNTGQYLVGDFFTVNILLNTEGADSQGVGIRYLNYNTSLLEVQDADADAAGTQISAGTLYQRTQVNLVDTTTGKIEFVQLTSDSGIYNSQNKQEILANVQFKALALGADNVFFNSTPGSTIDTNVASAGQDILGSVGNGFYTISTSSPADIIPPAAITNLTAANPTQTSIQLSWTAPGDDGVSGTALSYDIRYSTALITEANWATAVPVIGEPTPQQVGTIQYYTVSGLSAGTTYYFAMKTSDEVPNVSGFSNVVSAKTLSPPPPSGDGDGDGDGGGDGGGGDGGTPPPSDTTPPAAPAEFKASAGDGQIALSWKNPKDADFVMVKVFRDDKEIYEGVKESYIDINLVNDQTYTYSITACDKAPNCSENVVLKAVPKQGQIMIEPEPEFEKMTRQEKIAFLQAKIKQIIEQIALLRAKLTELLSQQKFTFTKNLKYGNRDEEVKKLQEILIKEGCLKAGLNTGWFGPLTFQSVVCFQEKYVSEILYPLGLKKGTGFVGPTTRAKLNKLLY